MSPQEIENEEPGAQERQRSGDKQLSEAEIDYIVMGTFPASDPPSWTLGPERRKGAPWEYQEEKPSADAPSYSNESTPSA